MLLSILAILIGYLIGSISPAFILGKVLKGIDIREYGDKNAGTTNVKRVLGIGPAIITAIFDLSKGLISMLIAYKLGLNPIFIYLSGFAAILGHIFPFYLEFRGGQGVATAVAILLLNLFLILRENFLPLPELLTLGILTAGLLYITGLGPVVGIVVLPGLAFFIYRNYPLNTTTITMGILVLYIFGINIYNIYSKKLFQIKPEFHKKVKLWRLLFRPAALVFPIILFNYDKKIALIFVGSVFFVFFIWDLVRLLHSKVNLFFFITKPGIFKEKEIKSFSSMTLFLLACSLVTLIFNKDIAVTAMVFLIFGDMFSKFFGIQYGRVKIFDRTLEGSIAYFIACFTSGYFILPYFSSLNIWTIFVGALWATLAELLPWNVDDNLSAGIIAGASMFLTQKMF